MKSFLISHRLSEEEKCEAQTWLLKHHPDWFPAFMAFKIKDSDHFPPTLFHNDVVAKFHSNKWWELARVRTQKKDNVPKEMCIFFKNLHSTVASSASVERIFSTFGLVWSKVRNRLGAEKAQKLVKIYRYFHNKEKFKLVN